MISIAHHTWYMTVIVPSTFQAGRCSATGILSILAGCYSLKQQTADSLLQQSSQVVWMKPGPRQVTAMPGKASLSSITEHMARWL